MFLSQHGLICSDQLQVVANFRLIICVGLIGDLDVLQVLKQE